MQAAILGLGLIGSEWARHLHNDGVLSATWNRTPKDFYHFTSDLKLAVQKASIIHVVVSDETAALKTVESFYSELSPEHIVIQSTTIDPNTSTTIKKLVTSAGAYYVEAPFTGSLPAAKERQTVFYLGTEINQNSHYQIARDYLKRLSSVIFDIGTNEQACAIKLAMNLMIASQIVTLSEAYSTCLKSGISSAVFFDVLNANAAASGVSKLKEPKLRAQDYSPQFSLKHMQKDMRLLTTIRQDLNLHQTVLNYLSAAVNAGLGEEDISAIIKYVDGI